MPDWITEDEINAVIDREWVREYPGTAPIPWQRAALRALILCEPVRFAPGRRSGKTTLLRVAERVHDAVMWRRGCPHALACRENPMLPPERCDEMDGHVRGDWELGHE